MIRRAPRAARFSVIDNRCIEDRSLTWGARGLLIYLLSKPDEWEVNVSHLVDQSPVGRDAVYALLKELKEATYILMTRNATGGVSYVVYDSPQPLQGDLLGEATSGKAGSAKATSGKATSGKAGSLINTDVVVSTDVVKARARAKKAATARFDPTTVDLPFGLARESWLKWCTHRAEIGHRLKPTTVELQLTKLLRYEADGIPMADVIRHSIEGGYQGLFAPKQAPTNGATHVRAETSRQSLADRAAESERHFSDQWQRGGGQPS